MGRCYWVLVWDAWGSGLDMVNARFLEREGGGNSWTAADSTTLEIVEVKHGLADYEHWMVIWSEGTTDTGGAEIDRFETEQPRETRPA